MSGIMKALLNSYRLDPIVVPVRPYPRTGSTLSSYPSDPILVPVQPYPRTDTGINSAPGHDWLYINIPLIVFKKIVFAVYAHSLSYERDL